MFKALASFCSVIIAIAVSTTAVASDPDPIRTINVSLSFGGDEQAVIWVADGMAFSDVAAVADAATKAGMTKITISVEREGSEPVPTHVSGQQHVGIQLSAGRAELFLEPRAHVPYAFIQTLSANLQELPNVSDVVLRSVFTKRGARQDATKASTESGRSTDPFAF